MSSPYATELKSSRKEIRVIDLQPSSSPSAPVSCITEEVSLLDKPVYIGLSYRWGEDTTAITVNGNPGFPVSRNLLSALRQLRDGTQAKVLWVDAICINQDPRSPEKNEQVAMMGDIYTQAILTVIWLGEEAANSNLAMDTVSYLYDHDVWEIADEPSQPPSSMRLQH